MAEENMEAIDDNSQKILAATNGQNIQTPKKSAKITQRTPSSLTSNLPNDYINQPNPNVTKGLPFYLNELISYPKEESRAFITNFRQLLYENLLSDPEEPKNIQTAFMTTFGFESQLLLPIAEELQKFQQINDYTSNKLEKDYAGIKNWTLILHGKPKNLVYGSGAYHPKLWLYKFPSFLRVVIGSGNLTIGDWTAWSNCLWFKDLPLKSLQNTPVEENLAFKNYLKFFQEQIIPEFVSFFVLKNRAKLGGLKD